jgi:copper chaperone CopZ
MLDQNARGSAQKNHSPEEIDDASNAQIAAIQIEGMDCVYCAERVQQALTALEGVVSAAVDWQQGLAIVDYVPTKTTVDALFGAVGRASTDGQRSYRAHRIGS